MEKIVVSLCPGCTSCPEVVIEGDHVRIGEAEMGPPEPNERRAQTCGHFPAGPSILELLGIPAAR